MAQEASCFPCCFCCNGDGSCCNECRYRAAREDRYGYNFRQGFPAPAGVRSDDDTTWGSHYPGEERRPSSYYEVSFSHIYTDDGSASDEDSYRIAQSPMFGGSIKIKAPYDDNLPWDMAADEAGTAINNYGTEGWARSTNGLAPRSTDDTPGNFDNFSDQYSKYYSSRNGDDNSDDNDATGDDGTGVDEASADNDNDASNDSSSNDSTDDSSDDSGNDSSGNDDSSNDDGSDDNNDDNGDDSGDSSDDGGDGWRSDDSGDGYGGSSTWGDDSNQDDGNKTWQDDSSDSPGDDFPNDSTDSGASDDRADDNNNDNGSDDNKNDGFPWLSDDSPRDDGIYSERDDNLSQHEADHTFWSEGQDMDDTSDDNIGLGHTGQMYDDQFVNGQFQPRFHPLGLGRYSADDDRYKAPQWVPSDDASDDNGGIFKSADDASTDTSDD